MRVIVLLDHWSGISCRISLKTSVIILWISGEPRFRRSFVIPSLSGDLPNLRFLIAVLT